MRSQNYKKIELDYGKRHFVFGDIHGRYEMFLDLLEQVKYDKDHDVIYSVGDLIDRGPHSTEVVEFFHKPNTYACLGNHERMVVNQKDWHNVWMNNGGRETIGSLGINDKDVAWLKSFCETLPVCLDVGDDGAPDAFRLVHAEIPADWSEETFRNYLIDAGEGASEGVLLWGRGVILTAINNILNKPGANVTRDRGIEFNPNRSGRTVFCGHTPIRNVVRVGDMVFLDTWESKTMTAVNACTGEIFTTQFK